MSEPSGTATSSPNGRARSPKDIERDIETTRARLAGTIDEIGERVKPANVVERVKDKALAQVVDGGGAVRTERVAALGGALLVFVGLLVVRARRRR